jgi:hypothetical protein
MYITICVLCVHAVTSECRRDTRSSTGSFMVGGENRGFELFERHVTSTTARCNECRTGRGLRTLVAIGRM